ncbi:MAG: HD domain-containing protein [Planctomycetes bacterium]|nr:HD domain-containing protein [Planctomycetota bacterium]
MIRRHINNVTPGMMLGKTIYGDNYEVLLKKGIELTHDHILGLKKRGIICVYVEDDDTADIKTQDIISEKVRTMVTKDVIKTYKRITEPFKDKNLEESTYEAIISSINSEKIKNSFRQNIELKQLNNSINLFIGEIMDKEIITGLNTIRTHDNYTYEHSVDTAIVALMFAKRLRLDNNKLKQIAIGKLLHDIGKIFIDPEILNKREKLSDHENEQIKKHPLFGYELLKDMEHVGFVAAHIAYQHHEWQDGTGYPRGLKGSNTFDMTNVYDINYSGEAKLILPAEIAAITDFYDACVTNRPFRPPIPHDIVYELIKNGAETHFNKELVKYFLELLPKYPVGTEIKIRNGAYEGFAGFVFSLNKLSLNRPIIKILYDNNKNKIEPFIIDLGAEGRDIEIRCVF